MSSLPVFVPAVSNQEAQEMRCGYRSKRCELPRSLKRNGKLHRFCDYHRMKANVNQRRVDQKRREMTQKQTADASVSPRSAQDASFLPDVAWYDDLDPEDLEYLDQLLSSGGVENMDFNGGDRSDVVSNK
ncbi:hypothetical protein F442_11811 [Phytophthora nicotianae P10297]|uniref:Uncharacterized protein n=1 Tax=Phytophthora nicotianae P10297 TaxID=1317064 RepID=W2Z0W4_PHYNI|nr:hypothetical protein F442_11811 [Phytophthora nicotianae P10297]